MTRYATTHHRSVTITSESVSEGHPDKVCDYIADSVVDAHLAEDANSRVACEVLCKRNLVVVAGEITSRARIDYEHIVREAIGQVGYTDSAEPFCADSVQILLALTRQSAEIGRAVDGADAGTAGQGAGDQGIMFGYATDETPELMPLPIVLAHALTKGLADDRRAGVVDWLRPDAKAQVSVVYEEGRPTRVSHVLVSTQHARHASKGEVVWHGSRKRCSCSSGSQRSKWMLTSDESKLRYQLHYGLTPIGQHRRLSDGLLNAVTRSCSQCDGEGLLGSHDLATWKICPDCRGFGSLPFPNSPELKAIRAQVAKRYPEAIVADADDVGPDSLRALLENGSVIVQDLQTGAMLWGSV